LAKKRLLVIGSPLYSGDHLSSQAQSYAVIAFRDGGRITVQEKTEYEISDYKYQQKKQENRSIHKLITGGMRVLTGHIGKIKKENYKINTPVATIGIRGTGFDLHYIKKKGLYSYVWQGTIDQHNQAGDNILTLSKSGYIPNENSLMKVIPKLPIKLLQNFPIRPDKVPINQEKLFKTTVLEGVPPGLYVTVHDGYVRLDSELDLGRNETGYVNPDKKMIRLELQQFQEQDVYPDPSRFNESEAKVRNYSLLVDNYSAKTAPIYECVSE